MEKWLIHGSSCSSDSAHRKWGSATQSAEGGEERRKERENRHSCRQLENENAFPCRRQWIFSLNKNALIMAGFIISPRGKRCNYTTGFWVSYDLCSSHNNSTTQLGSVINFGKTPKMPYSTKLTFYPGEALIKFEIFHCRWGSQMPKPSNLHTSGSQLPSRSKPAPPAPPLGSVLLGCQWNWNKPLLLLFYVQARN